MLLTLFSNTVKGIGISPVGDWKQALNGQRKVETVGVDARAYPIDIRSQFAFYFDFLRQVCERHPMPEPLGLSALEGVARRHAYPGLAWDWREGKNH